MAIKAVSIKCPECGASLDVEEGRKQIFCEYCGAKITLENDHEYIYRNIDEAEVKKAETERILKLKEIEQNEKAKREKSKKELAYAKQVEETNANNTGCFMLFAAIIFAVIGWIFDNAIWAYILAGGLFICGVATVFSTNVKIPKEVFYYKSKKYTEVESLLQAAGFTNITCLPLGDLDNFSLEQSGTVESITIDGKGINEKATSYQHNVRIVVLYHSRAEY